jgi:hypothetical protein
VEQVAQPAALEVEAPVAVAAAVEEVEEAGAR